MSSQYVEFIAFVTLSMLFTMLTTIWSTVKIREMQASRKRNHSEQIKAMWRVESQDALNAQLAEREAQLRGDVTRCKLQAAMLEETMQRRAEQLRVARQREQ